MKDYPLLNFFIKNTLAMTLLIALPDIIVTLCQVADSIINNKGNSIGIAALVLCIKCIALEFVIRTLMKDYKEQIIYRSNIKYLNLLIIPVIGIYYYILLSGQILEKYPAQIAGLMSLLMLGIQFVIVMKKLSCMKIYDESFLRIEDMKQSIGFNGFVEISIDLELKHLNFCLDNIKIYNEQLYYKDYIFSYERFLNYVREFNVNIKKMSDDDFMIAKMYCI